MVILRYNKINILLKGDPVMKKLNNLVAIFVAVVMMMTVLAIFPSSVGAVEAQQV